MVSGADDEAYTTNKRRIKRKRKRKKIERMWGGRECIAKVTVLRTDLLVHFTQSCQPFESSSALPIPLVFCQSYRRGTLRRLGYRSAVLGIALIAVGAFGSGERVNQYPAAASPFDLSIFHLEMNEPHLSVESVDHACARPVCVCVLHHISHSLIVQQPFP